MPESHQSGAQRQFGQFAPFFVEMTDEVLFGQVWPRSELARRERSLITVSALTAGGNTEQLRFHLKHAVDNGVTETELIETITHLAFYVGWPKAMSAMTVAKEVLSASGSESDPPSSPSKESSTT